jgi:hypothetical protein
MRSLTRLLYTFTGWCVIASQSALAQAPLVAQAGTRIRVTTTTGDRMIGRFVRLRGDSLWMSAEDSEGTVVYPGSAMRRFEMSLGRSRWRGARRGAAITGAISLVAIAFAVKADLEYEGDFFIPVSAFVAPAGVLLTLAGAGVGALAAPERWARPLTTINVGYSPQSVGGLSVAYRMSF